MRQQDTRKAGGLVVTLPLSAFAVDAGF